MAIYHLSVKIVDRKEGRSSVASAAYRAGEKLLEERTGIVHDYTKKLGVEHTEILAPEDAPDWVYNRGVLWNTTEKLERRKDSQLARDVELGLPVELDKASQLALLREYVKREYVARGMVADLSIHRDNPHNPHAHVLLSMRDLTKDGFGLKNRSWNERSALLAWRQGWAEVTNEHLAQAGLAVRIDHRTLKAQGVSLTPGRKIGVSKERQQSQNLPFNVADRIEEQKKIAHENGQRILAEPALALKAMTHTQATFSKQDIARFLHTRTEGAEQFQAAMLKVTTSRELVSLGVDDRNQERFTSREMLETEAQLLRDADRLMHCSGHGVEKSRQASVLSQHQLSAEQVTAFEHVTASGDLKALVGVAGSGKSRLLAAAREAWEAEGYTVKGAALSGIAAENLTAASGISSRTLAGFEWHWARDREPLTSRDVLVIDETGMVGTRQLARVLEVAHNARAKVVMVGDPEQLQAIEAGAPFRAVLAQSGQAELQEVQRQRHTWQRSATHQLAKGDTANALVAYEDHGALVQVATRENARTGMLARWAKDGQTDAKANRLMLAYTRDDVHELNTLARTLRQQQGQLGASEEIATERGARQFAVNDRLYFLRNEKSLGVKNGTLGTIESIAGGVLQVKLDGRDQTVAVDSRFYKDLDYGYAATVHKAQGSTVDRTYLLATPHYDRHATYVALSRHRESATVFYAAEDFGAKPAEAIDHDKVRARFLDVLSQARPKELVHDYLDREARTDVAPPITRGVPSRGPSVDDLQRQGREAWLAMQATRLANERAAQLQPEADSPQSPERSHPSERTSLSIDELQRQGREAWRRSRQQPPPERTMERDRPLEQEPRQGREIEGPELEP